MSISDMFHQAIRSKWFYLLFLLFFTLTNNNNSFAQNQSKYAVNDIIVSASGVSPSQSRTKAIADGQRNAFIILLGRLGIDESVSDSFQNEKIADMVASQQIFDEKIAGNKYSATLNLNFSESFVKYHLKTADEIEKSIDPNSYLIVPVKITKNQTLVWEEENDWKSSWQIFMKNNQYPQIKFLKGDVEDMGNFDIKNIIDDNFSKFRTSFYKYGVGTVVLAYFEFDSIENKVNIDLQTIQNSKNNQVRLEFVNVDQLPMRELVQKVIKRTADYIIKSNKAESNLGKSSPENTDIDILISDLKEWIHIKKKLSNSNLVENLKIKSISKDLVKINVDYGSDKDDIITAFGREGLFLKVKPEGGYFLSLKNFN